MNYFQQIQSRYRNLLIHQHEKPLITLLPSNEDLIVKRTIKRAGIIVGKGLKAKLVLKRGKK